MLQAIVHHGFVSDTIEYFATVAGPDLDRKFFFERTDSGGARPVRYFGGGSEVRLTLEGVHFAGNGGTFSEYMFGGHFPVQDLLNDEVVNRLVMFGGVYDDKTRELRFTPHTSGYETYENIFLQGNAVSNYFFFIDDRGRGLATEDRQERTLRSIGKVLKRSKKVGGGNFLDLASEILVNLGEPYSTLFLFRIVQRKNQKFYDACWRLYSRNRSLDDLTALVARLAPEGVDAYQRERIQIDVIYHHEENQELINEYKRVLASCSSAQIGPSERARLQRLRTLSLRNEVPLSIFDTLEEIVLQESATSEARLPTQQEPPYIQSTREILEGFLLGKTINKRLSTTDMVQLMENKQRAVENRNQLFEEILLETGRMIDESVRAEEDYERLESFGELITLFDRFDHTTTQISRMAFMDDVEMSQENVRSLLGNMHVFEGMRRGLFQSLFIDPIMANEYTLSFGRRKLYALILGLISIDNNEASLADVTAEIHHINRQERAYFAMYSLARRRMATFYLELNTAEGRETFRKEIADEVVRDPALRDLQDLIGEQLIDEVITKIRLEAFYINQLLPKIIDQQDGHLRKDFLANSGLDRFQVEELESEYFEMRNFPPQLLQAIRQRGAAA
ncbi:MAG: TIGR04442 family protein [Thermoanaerobaculia bacterium]